MNNSWHEYQKLVLHELEFLNEQVEKLDKEYNELNLELVRVQERIRNKALIWGALAGALPAVITALALFIKG